MDDICGGNFWQLKSQNSQNFQGSFKIATKLATCFKDALKSKAGDLFFYFYPYINDVNIYSPS